MKVDDLPTDQEIDDQRVAGDITLVLLRGAKSERESLLRVIGRLAGQEQRKRLEEWSNSWKE